MLNRVNKGGGKYELHTANAIWLQKDYPFLEGYKDVVNRYYVSETRELDFVDDPGGSCDEINGWVSSHTKNKIEEIIQDVNTRIQQQGKTFDIR